jgi:hypothetical protein
VFFERMRIFGIRKILNHNATTFFRSKVAAGQIVNQTLHAVATSIDGPTELRQCVDNASVLHGHEQ